MANIRKIVEDAMEKVRFEKNPDLEEFRNAVNPILSILKLGTLSEYDKIDKVYEYDGRIYIEFSYSDRSFLTTNDTVKFPAILMDNCDKWVVEELYWNEKKAKAKSRCDVYSGRYADALLEYEKICEEIKIWERKRNA